MDDAAEDVAAELVGTEQMRPRWAFRRREVLRERIVRRDQRREDRDGDKEEHDGGAEQGRLIVAKAIPDQRPLRLRRNRRLFGLLAHQPGSWGNLLELPGHGAIPSRFTYQPPPSVGAQVVGGLHLTWAHRRMTQPVACMTNCQG